MLKELFFLILFTYFNNIFSLNNYILEKECTKNTDNSLIECFLTYNQPSNPQKENFLNIIKIIKKLKVELRNLEGNVSHLKIFDSENKRYEIPRDTIEYFEKNKPFQEIKNFYFDNLKKGEIFTFDYKQDSTNTNLFTLFNQDLIFSDDYIKYNYIFNSDQIFGYGERSSEFKLNPGTYTSWPRDMSNLMEDGLGARNSYGHQPFILIRNSKNIYIGISFLNSNAQDLIINKKNLDGKISVQQISIGGIIELLIINGNSPLEVLQKYHTIIGKPALPNYWALGWHQSRWGYKNTSHLRNVIKKFNENKIPIDVIWSDIDYMQNFEDFGFDNKTYAGLPDFVNEVKKDGINFIPILDMGIPYRPDNRYYKLGKSLDVFIKSNYTGTDLLNTVWPGDCVFPDFTKYSKAKTFWQTGLSELKNLLNFDGIWLDMNEPSGFEKGEVLKIPIDTQKNKYNNLSYMPGGKREDYDLNNSSLSINGLMSEEYFPFNTVFNLKPLNVFYENKITYEYLISLNKRPFILSRSSFIGMGRYSSHWLGDNFSYFSNMTASIAGIFNFQMFGFNLVGADICGNMFDATDELCSRWTVLGAFYTFSRNHNNYTCVDQEPYSLGNLTLNAGRNAIRTKYSLLRYFYTQMYFSSINGGAFFQPLFFQFPDVDELIENPKVLNQQIMLGPAILFNPILEETEKNVIFAFPNENWNVFPSGKSIYKKKDNPQNLEYLDLPGRFSDLHLFVRGGFIVPFYDTIYNENILRSKDLENHPISLIINPDGYGKATGDIIYDDTYLKADDVLENKLYLHIKIRYDIKNREIRFDVINDYNEYKKNDRFISEIIICSEEKFIRVEKFRFLYENKINLEISDGKTILKFNKLLDIRKIGIIKF